MNVAIPTAFFWALLAVPIIVLYILKIRLRRVPVSTIMFWRKIYEEKQPRSIWQRLRHLLSLLLQLLFLLLLVLALSKPYFFWESREARRIVLVIDNSASMQANDLESTRLEEAKKEAYRLIKTLRPRDEMAIVSAGTQPKVLCGLTGHQKTLREAVDSVGESDGPTRVAEAMSVAKRLLADHANGQVVVLSDGCFAGAKELAGHENVVWHQLGKAETGNVGITQFQVRRSLIDPVGYHVLVEVTNCSDETVEFHLEMELDGDIVDVIPLTLEPDQRWSEVFEKTSAEGGQFLARVQHNDALPADNLAWGVLPERPRQPVVLVTEGNVFLTGVFQANNLVDLTLSRTIPQTLPDDAILVLHRTVPETIPEGQVIVIDPTASTDLWDLAGPLEFPAVAKVEEDSDLMANVKLDHVLMPEARRLNPHGDAVVLAEAGEGEPLYFYLRRDSGAVLVLTVNLDQGDLPLRTAFPILMSNALAWFAGTKGELRQSLPTGSIAEVELPASLKVDGGANSENRLVLQSPGGESSPLPDDGETVTIGPLRQSGIWRIATAKQSGDAAALKVACNLANREESDLRVPKLEKANRDRLTAGVGGRPMWFYLVALACLLTGTEWYLYQRRWIQ